MSRVHSHRPHHPSNDVPEGFDHEHDRVFDIASSQVRPDQRTRHHGEVTGCP